MDDRDAWTRRIEDTTHDRVAWNSIADASPWDGFYREYRWARPDQRALADEAFVACRGSDDPCVVAVLILHTALLPAARAVALLLEMLDQRADFLQAHRGNVSERSLLALALCQLAERAICDLPDAVPRARDLILARVAQAGPTSTVIGRFFRQLGPEAVQSLAAVLGDRPEHQALLAEARG